MTHASTSEDALDSRSDSSVVDSLLHPQAVLIRALLQSKPTKAGDLILVDDVENIVQARRAGLIIRSVFRSEDAALGAGLLQQLPSNVARYQVAWRTCKKLFGNERVSRVFAIVEAPPSRSLDTLLPLRRDIVVLDGIGISGNVGAIVRTGSAMGIGGIVIVNADGANVFDRRVIRASRGHVFGLPVIVAPADELVRFCAVHRVRLVVTQPRAGTSIDAISSEPRPLAIVLGGEKRGPSPALVAAATRRLEIPMGGSVESLNVAAAAAIALYCRHGFHHGRASAGGRGSASPA